MIFQFEHLDLWGKSKAGGLDLPKLKQVFHDWQTNLHGKGWNALFLENHDQPRSVSTWGNDGKYHVASAKALATMYFLMQGTPFIYQGQEIGMTNVTYPSIEDYDDISYKNLYANGIADGRSHEEMMEIVWKKSRDNSRTPMQWSKEPNAGFTTGTPWLKVNPNFTEINVENAIEEPESIFHYYRKLIQLRKENLSLIYGSFALVLKEHQHIFGYTRTLDGKHFLILVNLFDKVTKYKLPKEFAKKTLKPILSNYEFDRPGRLHAYEARVYQINEGRMKHA